jgi:hypothetical protein
MQLNIAASIDDFRRRLNLDIEPSLSAMPG